MTAEKKDMKNRIGANSDNMQIVFLPYNLAVGLLLGHGCGSRFRHLSEYSQGARKANQGGTGEIRGEVLRAISLDDSPSPRSIDWLAFLQLAISVRTNDFAH